MIPAWKISLPLTCLTALINGEGCTENKALKPYPSQPRVGLDQPAGPRGCGGRGGGVQGSQGPVCLRTGHFFSVCWSCAAARQSRHFPHLAGIVSEPLFCGHHTHAHTCLLQRASQIPQGAGDICRPFTFS